MKAVILAGGFGTRLKSVVKDVPKPMALIAGKPFLEHQIRFLKEQGITDIILAIHYMADKIKTYFGDGKRFGINITYSEEEFPLGTGGAIKKAEKYIDDSFFVLNGDSYSQIDLKEFLEFHKSKKSNFSISLTMSKNFMDCSCAVMEENKVIEFSEKLSSRDGLINTGVYIFEPKIFDFIEAEKNVSLENDIFPKLAKNGLLFGYNFNGYFMDIGKPETYCQFKKDVLKTFFMRESSTIKGAMEKISKTGIEIILIVDEQERLLGILNDRIVKEYIIKGGNLEDSVGRAMIRDPITAKITDNREKILELVLSGTHRLPILDEIGRIVDMEFYAEKIREEAFPIVYGKAPLRISFAGGGTDFSTFFSKYGGAVINATINKYCYGIIIKRADTKIIIDSDFEEEMIVNSLDDLSYDGKLDLVKAVIKLTKPDFGFELYLYNDLPPGRGLGSSATSAVLIASLLNSLQNLGYNDYKIAEIAYNAERKELKIEGGWQDQYSTVAGGFNFMEFSGDKTLVYPLRLKEGVIKELNNHLILCYVGKSHFSGDLQKDLEKSFLENEKSEIENLNIMKKMALKIRDILLTDSLEEFGQILDGAWRHKKSLGKEISNPKIDHLYEVGLKNGAYGGKLLGAGNGGYILFFFQPKKRNQLKKALKIEGGEIMNFNFEFKGVQTWISKNKF